MLQPILGELASKVIVLASTSPRRIELLKSINLPFKSVPSTFEENLNPKDFSSPSDFTIETAKQKALAVANSWPGSKVPDLIIGADTVVTFENQVYGKPKDKKDAFDMLKRFSSQTHSVYTGVVFCTTSNTRNSEFKVHTFYEKTDVVMTKLSDKTIDAYIETGEPMDKAGSYGIQGLGGTFVESIHGDYYNVMGLPLHRICKEILKLYTST